MLAARVGDVARRAQPHAPVPRQVGRAARSSSRRGCSSTRSSRPPTCSPTAPTRCRWGRTSASTSSSCATSRGASTRASARSLVVPEHRIPVVGARVRDLQEPERKMSTTGGTEQGTVYVLDEPDAIRRKFRRAVTDSGTRDRARARQAGRVQPDRDPRRGARRGPRGDRARVRRRAATASSRPPSATRWPSGWRRCASATPSCGATRRRSRSMLAAGAEKARAIACGDVADVRDAMGVGPAPSAAS